LITRYGSLDGLIESVRLSETDLAYVRSAREVVTPGSPDPVGLPAGLRDEYPADPDAAYSLVEQLGIQVLVDRLPQALRSL
jgi:hypothetical protein